MSGSFAREIGLLRTVVAHLEQRPLPNEQITQAYLKKEGLGHIRERADSILGIRAPGHSAFADLAECLTDRLPAMARGTVHAHVQTELFTVMETYVGRAPDTVSAVEAAALIDHFKAWYEKQAEPRRVFVPCVISRRSAPSFAVGPVRFVFIDSVRTSEFYPAATSEGIDKSKMDRLLTWMRERDADWLARVEVLGCERTRAEEIGELAVDLAIVALQLIAPNLNTRSMCRLDDRRGTSQKRTLSEAHGHYAEGWTRKEPGMAIGSGTMAEILRVGTEVAAGVGYIVSAFVTGLYRLPVLEKAWCDSAYWLHQALAESIDTIAVAKLETALEVLVAAESAPRSTARILDILKAFFSVGPDDPIYPGSMVAGRKFAQNLVRDRSRILHGTWSTLNARGMDRTGLEGFVISVLRMAAVELDAYAQHERGTDSIDGFLGWMVSKQV